MNETNSELALIGNRIDPNSTHLDLAGLGLTKISGLGTQIRAGHVESLDLSRNRLTEIPREIRWLPALRALDLSENRIDSDMMTAFTDPKHELWGFAIELRELYLRNNALQDIPIAIYYFPGLRILDVSHNEIQYLTRLPKLRGLEILDLSHNRVRRLPADYVHLEKCRVVINGNQITSPPPEIVAQGHQAILDFFGDSPAVKQWRSKLLFVGEGGVGKSSALDRLLGDGFDPKKETTHGLNTATLTVPHPHELGVNMDLHAWDFGGQQIYHATHQFYLTTRSLYLLFWNARLGWEQGRLHYWLEIIRARAPRSPIIVAATHCDERFAELPSSDLKRKFPDIACFVELSSKTGSGIDQLRSEIQHCAARLPLMGEKWPRQWAEAADAINSNTELYESPDAVRAVLRNNQVGGDNIERLLTTLHELGDILFYPDDATLREIVILRPKWVTEHIAKVLDDTRLADTSGIISNDRLSTLWYDLAPELRRHFVRLMEKFDLSYQLGDYPDKHLVVERLPLDPPADAQRWIESTRTTVEPSVRMIYRLSSLPPGVPTWFIARSHRFSAKQHWRYGAVFCSADNRHRGYVRVDIQHRTLELASFGPFPQELFTILKDGLEYTLERFPGMGIERYVPCRCRGTAEVQCSHQFSYEQLRRRLEISDPKRDIECPESISPVSVREMLLGLHEDSNDLILERIDTTTRQLESRFADHRAEMRAELRNMLALLHREWLKGIRREQRRLDSTVPSVFTVVPTSGRMPTSVIGQKFNVQLYCEYPGGWHAAPGDPYSAHISAKWWSAIGPHLAVALRYLRKMVPLISPAIGVAASDLQKSIENDLKLSEEALKALPELSISVPVGLESSTQSQVRDRSIRVQEALSGMDPQGHWQDLRLTVTPEGDGLWLCEVHSRQYRL